MEDEHLRARATQVEKEGRGRLGDNWDSIVSAVGRAGPSAEMVANTLQAHDAVSQFERVGKEILLREMTSEDRHTRDSAEAAYNKLRQAERESRHPASAYRRLAPNMSR